MSSTSIGRGPASGGNENHDGDPRHVTMGEAVQQERPAGSKVPEAEAVAPGTPQEPAAPASGKVVTPPA
jgi:hypothetical protein